MVDTIEVFISYSKQDKELRDGLLAHLRPLEREGIITWHDRQILPGTEWDEEIKARLNAADIILLLISADFLATDYCTQVEIPEALRRHEAGEATVMPVILRACSWKRTPLAAIQAYPEKAKPIRSWTDIDEAYTDIVEGVYLAATEIKKRRNYQHQAQEQQRQQELERKSILELQRREGEQSRRAAQTVSADELASERDVDYTRLRDLLKAGKWKEADQETAARMCEAVAGQQHDGLLNQNIIRRFPRTDLRTIDELWVEHSQGRFGFSVQKKIWQKLGSPDKDYGEHYEEQLKKFRKEVGWEKKAFLLRDSWKSYSELTFNISAPVGHLPLGGVWGWRHSMGVNLSSNVWWGGQEIFQHPDL